MAMKMKTKPNNNETEPSKEVVQTGVVQPWLGPKKGSVFPARRRLVKRMVFDSLVKSTASAFLSCFGFLSSSKLFRRPAKATSTYNSVPYTNKNIKNDVVFPEP